MAGWFSGVSVILMGEWMEASGGLWICRLAGSLVRRSGGIGGGKSGTMVEDRSKKHVVFIHGKWWRKLGFCYRLR